MQIVRIHEIDLGNLKHHDVSCPDLVEVRQLDAGTLVGCDGTGSLVFAQNEDGSRIRRHDTYSVVLSRERSLWLKDHASGMWFRLD